jgi:hypothetical protein
MAVHQDEYNCPWGVQKSHLEYIRDLWNFLQHSEIFVVHVASPGDDTDKFLLPFRPKPFWGASYFMKKIDTLQIFVTKNIYKALQFIYH